MNAFWDRTFNHDVDITTEKNRRKPFTRVSDVRAAFAWFLELPALREKRAGEPMASDPAKLPRRENRKPALARRSP